MVFKPLNCLLTSQNGRPCRRYLADLEAGVPVTLRFTCSGKHETENNRIEFSQDASGVVYYLPLDGKTEKKIYADDGVRVSK